MTQEERKVIRIACITDGDGPAIGMSVGQDGVSSIDVVYEDLGTYSIKWFTAFDDNKKMIGEINALGVQTVVYD